MQTHSEKSDAQILEEVELQQRAEQAWSNAWDRAHRADLRAGRPYNRHTYADAAHRASVKVKGVCLKRECKAHPASRSNVEDAA